MENSTFEIKDVNAYYGKSHVLHDVSLQVKPGEKVVILGRNGMGKSTLLKSIMRIGDVTRTGSIIYGDKELISKRTSDIARSGIGYVPQGWQLFPSLSVAEHLTIAYKASKSDADSKSDWSPERLFKLFPEIDRRRKISGTSLSGGEQQILAICRALVTNSQLILMDEPSEGISAKVLDRIVGICKDLAAENKSILLVEQNLNLAMRIAERVYILVNGAIVYETTSEEFKDDKEKHAQYLGI